jgi:CBS domain-containing protein
MSLNLKVRVKAAMTRNIVTADRKHSIRSAIRRMVRNDVGSVLITEDSKPVGIVTERDVLKNIGYGRLNPDNEIGALMSKPLITVNLNSTLAEAAELMTNYKIRRVPVKDGDEFVGIITQRDLQIMMMGTFKSLLLL